MACKFSFFLKLSDAYKENDVGVFQSDNKDQYIVRYKSNVCRDLLLRVEWKIPKQILVTIKLYTTTFKRCFSSKGIVVNGTKTFVKMRGAFNVSNSRDYKILCIINLIPYITLNECSDFKAELLESEYLSTQSLIVHGKNSFVDNELKLKNGNVEKKEVSNISTMEIDAMSVESINSEPAIENEYQNDENNFMTPKNVLVDGLKIKESNIVKKITYDDKKSKVSAILTSNGSIDSCNQMIQTQANNATYELSEGYLESVQVLENERILEKNLKKGNDVKIINKVQTDICESVSLNDIANEMNDLAENRLVSEKMLTLRKSDEEINRNLNSNIDKVRVPKNSFGGKKLAKEVDSTKTTENNLVSNENNLSYSKLNEVDSLKDKTSKINQASEIQFEELMQNEDRSYLANDDETAISTENIDANLILDSNDVSMKSNQMYQEDLRDLSNYESCSYTKNTDSSLIQNDDQLLIEGSTSPLIEKTSVAPGDIEIDDKMVETEQSTSTQFPSSKTRLLFQKLIQKLSTTDCDLESTDMNDRRAKKSGRSSKKKSDKLKKFPIVESELKGLSMDMLDLLTSGDLADAVITNGDKNIKVHRAIICTRSPPFKEMFIKHIQDDINYQAIVDIPSSILEDIIVFLYTGLIHIKNTKMAQDVLKIAERYIINDLIDICSKHVKK